MDVDKIIQLLEEVKRVQTLQKERGVNSIRKDMIDKMLFDVQKEVVWGLRDNARVDITEKL